MALFSNLTSMGQPSSTVNNNNNVLSGGQTQGMNQMVSQEMVKGEGVFANNPFMNMVNKSTSSLLSMAVKNLPDFEKRNNKTLNKLSINKDPITLLNKIKKNIATEHQIISVLKCITGNYEDIYIHEQVISEDTQSTTIANQEVCMKTGNNNTMVGSLLGSIYFKGNDSSEPTLRNYSDQFSIVKNQRICRASHIYSPYELISRSSHNIFLLIGLNIKLPKNSSYFQNSLRYVLTSFENNHEYSYSLYKRNLIKTI
ncbi:hypothetical protein PPL_12488 [Heterostelium album PN500]|uniref:Uncharacterized protein n=1 Tax=Heterostelium pallidum (strain ATCC 26659 / Pp 5 / PN500) TaxID=670386 RepID=D3BMR5_HETP5|nr:hypothetical protein PPL_12488 [Heterostelium album PN500]EFA77277.1 hypothetical protein PPL_12488 [Heterostelium album PN500]|eukprot:XP_020429406.1 hypothetical protein PPL_12488 [Heterostelium album PN500]